jgi:hypothetical protein
MKESVGSIPLYNIIFAFLIVTFSFLAGTLAYSKAFRVSTKIIYSLEVFDGYNPRSINEINRVLNNMGYRKITSLTNTRCTPRPGAKTILSVDSNFFYCIYEYNITIDGDLYYYWGASAFMYFDIPFVGELMQVPIYTSSDTYYRFPKEFPITD